MSADPTKAAVATAVAKDKVAALRAEQSRSIVNDLRDPIRAGFYAAHAATIIEAARLAYGLLWHMALDHDRNSDLAKLARAALYAALSDEDRYLGIDAAKMTDARFTGAA